jgi:hypothetical protein
MPRMWRAVSAESVESISGTAWPGTGARSVHTPAPLSLRVKNAALDLRGDTVRNMSSRMQNRRRRRLLALVLAAVAVGLVVVEPFPKGTVLLSLTSIHGVDAGDLPAVVLLLVAVRLAI